MAKYKVVYESRIDHDCCSVWVRANTREQAIDEVRSEYWDVASIIECYEID